MNVEKINTDIIDLYKGIYNKCAKCGKQFQFAEVRMRVTTQMCSNQGAEPCIVSKNESYWHHVCLFPQG